MGFIFNTDSITPDSGSGGGSSPVIESLTITPSTSEQIITVPSGIDGYGPITVYAANLLNGDTLNITPSTSAQTLTPISPKNGFTQVNVNAVTSSIDANIVAENIKKDVTILSVTGTYEGSGGGSTGKYQLLQRVKDDSNNEIGTVSGFFTDANNVEYAVVCLDSIYRKDYNCQWATTTGTVTNMPIYLTWGVWSAKETATQNTTLILAAKTSTTCDHCRQYSFVIDGVTYYGQLPNIIEWKDIAKNYAAINSLDTSEGDVPVGPNNLFVSSTQYDGSNCWIINSNGCFYFEPKRNYSRVCPVLEIPNAL